MRRDRRGSVSRDLRRAADCSPGLWRIIKLAEESLRAPRRGGQLGWLVILSLSLSLSLFVGIMPPFATFPRMELQTSASLPGEKRQKSGASYPPLFSLFLPFFPFFFPSPSSPPNTAFFFSGGGHHANAN